MDYKHTKKGFYVGTFNDAQIKNKEMQKAVAQAMQDSGCKFVNITFVKKDGITVEVMVYVCTFDEMELQKSVINI